MKLLLLLRLTTLCLLGGGCPATPAAPAAPVPPPSAFDPWTLTNTPSDGAAMAYVCDGRTGRLMDAWGRTRSTLRAGDYVNGDLPSRTADPGPVSDPARKPEAQRYDLHTGVFSSGTTHFGPSRDWPRLWRASDVVIRSDPEAQQVTHAGLFFLLSSTYPGSDHSIPPYGLSVNGWGGHIFWDAEVWMMPALLVQHPEDARGIVDYRFKTLAQAQANARQHGFAGAEYPWESADTGAERAAPEYARERHITADVGWAAWQYYLWTGDKAYLRQEGWPILQATAAYWASRVTAGAGGAYHIKGVVGADEDAGVVDDDAWTNAVVAANLRAAARAARLVRQAADPRWEAVAAGLSRPTDPARGIPAESARPMGAGFMAKQADALLLLYPLDVPLDAATQGRMLDFYAAHVSPNGPAMTAGIESIVAARLGRRGQSLVLFRASYRPFLRRPWDTFSETPGGGGAGCFCTGIGGCLQSILYGFAGLRVVPAGEPGRGTRLAGDGEASLYADPHLPPGWGGLTVKGVKFRGKTFDVAITAEDKVTVTPQ